MEFYDINDSKTFRFVTVNGHEYMFTNMRIDRVSLPAYLYAYDVRDDRSCTKPFALAKKYIPVGHWGTIIGVDPLPLDETGSYYPGKDDGEFTGKSGTLREYLEKHHAPYITWFTAECMDTHSAGRYAGGMDLFGAATLYLQFLADGNLMGASLGFAIHDPGLGAFDGTEVDLVQGTAIHGDALENVRLIASHPLAKKAVREARGMFPCFKYIHGHTPSIEEVHQMVFHPAPVDPAPLMEGISRQLKEKETETEFGEYQSWVYLKSGRSIEVCYESHGLPEDESFYSIRLHCNDAEFGADEYHSTMGIIHQEVLAHGEGIEKAKYRVAALITRFGEELAAPDGETSK